MRSKIIAFLLAGSSLLVAGQGGAQQVGGFPSRPTLSEARFRTGSTGQQVRMVLGESAFTGNCANDPTFHLAYNIADSGGNLISNGDPHRGGYNYEANYENQFDTGTATAGTTDTVVNDTGKALATNVYAQWCFHNVTRSQSRLIASNTATSYTLASAIAGQVSTDTYRILRRDAELYLDHCWFAGGNLECIRPFFSIFDRGTSEFTDSPRMVGMQIKFPRSGNGLEFEADGATDDCMRLLPGEFTVIGCTLAAGRNAFFNLETAGTGISQMLMKAGNNVISGYWTAQPGNFSLQTQNSTGGNNQEAIAVTNSGTTLRMDLSGSVTFDQSATAPDINTGGTIDVTNVVVARVVTGSAVTGIILEAGTLGGQQVVVFNEDSAANTITFAAEATSNVCTGTGEVIAGQEATLFLWIDNTTDCWAPAR